MLMNYLWDGDELNEMVRGQIRDTGDLAGYKEFIECDLFEQHDTPVFEGHGSLQQRRHRLRGRTAVQLSKP
jgi:hypothetical protein